MRYYASGRSTYIVQSLMNGVTRTITLGNANVLSKSQALTVARRILLRAQVGEGPATKRKETRKVPTYDDFLTMYWKQAAAKWKPSTLRTHHYYRRRHLDHAFFGMFIDEIEQSHVLTWFNKVSVGGGPALAIAASKSCVRCSTMPSAGVCAPKGAILAPISGPTSAGSASGSSPIKRLDVWARC